MFNGIHEVAMCFTLCPLYSHSCGLPSCVATCQSAYLRCVQDSSVLVPAFLHSGVCGGGGGGARSPLILCKSKSQSNWFVKGQSTGDVSYVPRRLMQY